MYPESQWPIIMDYFKNEPWVTAWPEATISQLWDTSWDNVVLGNLAFQVGVVGEKGISGSGFEGPGSVRAIYTPLALFFFRQVEGPSKGGGLT